MAGAVKLRNTIEQLFAVSPDKLDRLKARKAVKELKQLLNSGEVRAAEFGVSGWVVNEWVKKGILLAFRAGVLKKAGAPDAQFFDKDTMDLRRVTAGQNLRVVPGGSAIRDWTY